MRRGNKEKEERGMRMEVSDMVNKAGKADKEERRNTKLRGKGLKYAFLRGTNGRKH